jgi:ligand-binding sensor domain-containing protein
MKVRIKYLALIVVLISSLFGLSQSAGIGTFYDHLPYNTCNVVCLADDKVYVGSGQTLFTYSLSDNSIETFSKVNKLSDLGVNAIAYSSEYSTLLIGYNTGNIDVIVNNQIINVPDIERTIIQGVKSINNIYVKDNYAYLSTGFGVIQFDIQRREIKETFFIGDNASNVFVNDLTFYNDTIFVATSDGMYCANANSSNLSNFQNWQKLNRFEKQNINTIESNDSLLILNIQTENYLQDTLYSYNGSIWNTITYPKYDHADVFNINIENNKWLFSQNYNARIVSSNFNESESIYTYGEKYGSISPRAIISGNSNDYWIADNKHGLIRKTGTWQHQVFTPAGPAYYECWKMDFEDNALWVASGTLTSQLGNNYNKKGTYKYSNNKWQSFGGGGYDSLYDITTVNINPINPSQIYFGTWGRGLIQTNNGSITNVFNRHNSEIQSLNLETYKPHYIGGSTFDKNNTLWVTCSGAPGASVNYPLVAFDGENWFKYDLNNLLVNNTNIGEIFVDPNGYKWMASRDNGIFVFDDNETLNNKDDDRVQLITTGENSGSLPTKVVFDIAQDKDGEIWIGSEEGLMVINSTFDIFEGAVKAERIIIEQDESFEYLLETEIINTIKVDGGNRKWIGTASSGAYLLSEDGQETIHHFTAENSALLSNTIFDIEIFGTTGEVFFATDRGIVSYTGDATDSEEYKGPTYAYPNPVRPDYEGLIGIRGLVENSEVKITDISGNLIYETISEGGTATWNGKSLNGKRAQTGVYIVFSASDDGLEKEVAKILFIN